MDDLSGLDWSSSSSANKQKPTLAAQSAAFSSFSYPSLQPTPPPLANAGSGRNTPLSTLSALSNQGSGASTGARGQNNSSLPASTTTASKAAQDSFSGLISFGSGGASKNPANLSLRERQEQLNAERRRKEEERRKQNQANYGDGQFFDALGRGGGSTGTSRTGSPALAPPGVLPSMSATSRGSSPLNGGANAGGSGDDDLFAAFSADTKVDNSTYFPPPASHSGKSTPANAPLDLSSPSAWGATAATATKPTTTTTTTTIHDDDDDPFGLSQFQAKTTSANAPPPINDDDDDFLGDLGKPVEEVRRKTEAQQHQRQPEPGKPIEGSDSDSDTDTGANGGAGDGVGGVVKTGNPQFDNAVAQLVDYGFSPEDAQRGLTESGRGFDVQAAVNFLLDDAHRKAKEKSRGKTGGGEAGTRGGSSRGGGPAWMRESESAPGRGESRPSASGAAAGGEDFAKTAAAMGTSFLKTANSLWKTGQKQLQKAVQDFQHEGAADPNQPKWMRSAAQDASSAGKPADATDEAMMLESGGRPERRQPGGGGGSNGSGRPSAPISTPKWSDSPRNGSQTSSRTQSPANASGRGGGAAAPRWQQTADPRARLNKQAIEEESAKVYVSPARRRKAATPSPAPPPPPLDNSPFEGDLLSNSTALPQRPAQPPARTTSSASRSTSAMPKPRPSKVARQVPPVNSFVLKASAKHRADGAAHFKRGDYAAAHASYTASLTDIPTSHPLLAVLFCNRALTALKTGEPRQAVADADAALEIIGPAKGEGETVGLEDGTGATRDLKDLYGKAVTRKAEALEQMEKWSEAGQVWQQCVEDGVGGATAIAGRQRCQTAVQKPKAATPKPVAKPRPGPRPSASLGTTGSGGPVSASGRDFEAVQRLRAANAAAAREDSERRGLVDAVDARIAAWRDGKKDNIRALLGSLEKVLWEGSGWKSVGLHELVMPNKVKIVYMRAIAKTHPDKLPQDASTEVRMIAGTVFATLNEGWDKFKADNKM